MTTAECLITPLDGHLLKDFRDDGLFTDVTISVGSQHLKAHKIVLAARSDVFRAMFTCGMSESTGTVVIRDIEPDVFRDFLNYLYTGESELVQQRPADMLICADKYNIESLHAACDLTLSLLVTTENLAELNPLIDIFNLPQTKAAIVELLVTQTPSPIFGDQVWSVVVGNFEIFTNIVVTLSRHFYFQSVDVRSTPKRVLSVQMSSSIGFAQYSVNITPDLRGECLEVGLRQEGTPPGAPSDPPASIVLIESEGKAVYYEKSAPKPFRNLLQSRIIARFPTDCMYLNSLTVSVAFYSSIRIFRGIDTELSKEGNSVHTKFDDFFRFYEEFIADPANIRNQNLNKDNVVPLLCELKDSQDLVLDRENMKIFQYLIFHMDLVSQEENWKLLRHRPDLMLQIMLVIKGISDWSHRFRIRKFL